MNDEELDKGAVARAVASAVARIREAVARRSEQARIDEAEKQQRAADEAVIDQTRKRLAMVSRLHGTEQDMIWQLERDIYVARENVRVWSESIARQEIQLEEHKREREPLAKELAELRGLLNGVE
jgi:chromosome segregation ATPase